MHGRTLPRGAQLQTLFSLNSDFSSPLAYPSPPSSPSHPPSPPDSLHPQSAFPALSPLCLASNHFFLALISSCRAVSNQEIMGPRAQQGTLLGRGLRPQTTAENWAQKACQPPGPSSPAPCPFVLVTSLPGVGGRGPSSASVLSGETRLGMILASPMWSMVTSVAAV